MFGRTTLRRSLPVHDVEVAEVAGPRPRRYSDPPRRRPLGTGSYGVVSPPAGRIERVDVNAVVDGPIGGHGALGREGLEAGQGPLAGEGVGVAAEEGITRV